MTTLSRTLGTALLAASCLIACGGERNPTGRLPDTLQGVRVIPDVAVVAPLSTQQFIPEFDWPDGQAAGTVPVTFAIEGVGTVSATGLYTAPPAAGTGRVILSVDGSTLKDTAQITVTNDPPGSGLYPNEPAGFSRFAEHDFSGVPGTAGTQGTLDGNFQTLRSPATRIAVASDASAPQSPSGVLQVDFAQGTQPGFSAPTGYRLFTGWDGPDNLSNTEYSEIYESTRFKIQGVNGTNFETNTVGVKMLGYWGVADNNGDPASSPGPVQLYSLFMNSHEGGPGTSLETRFNINMYTQGVNSEVYPQNRNLSKRAQVGAWHQFEIYMRLNTIGQANGVWRWWLDGVLLGEYTNMTFITASRPSGFFGRTFDPVWGGSGATAKTRTDYLWLDHMYISGVFLRSAGR